LKVVKNMIREDLMDRLHRLDEDADLLFNEGHRFRLIIVGGSALILLEAIDRATHDIDAIDVSLELISLLDRYDINCRVQTYINNFPYNYEDRIKLLFSGEKIDFYTASLEDIVIAKLFSWRGSDQKDVESPSVVAALDWNLLNDLATNENEARASALNARCYQDFLANYESYVRRYHPCAN
jgi:hypothetical protein